MQRQNCDTRFASKVLVLQLTTVNTIIKGLINHELCTTKETAQMANNLTKRQTHNRHRLVSMNEKISPPALGEIFSHCRTNILNVHSHIEHHKLTSINNYLTAQI